MSCDLIYGRTHRTIQEQVTHPKINDENFSLRVGNDGSYFCAKSLSDLEQVANTMLPLLQKLQTTSEKATLKVVELQGIFHETISFFSLFEPKFCKVL